MQDTGQTPPPSRMQTQGSGSNELWRAATGLLRAQGRLLAGLVLALVLAEAALRIWQPQLADLVYARDMTGGHDIRLDAQGYRVSDAAAMPSTPPRLLGLGDSTTFGTGVGADQTWPLILAQQLDEAVSARNAGAEGGELREFAFGLQQVWTGADSPDIAVLMITANMISFTDFRWGNPPRDPRRRITRLQNAPEENAMRRQLRSLGQSSALWKAVSIHITGLKFALGLNSHRVDPERPLSPLMAYGWLQPDVPPEVYPRMWQRFDQSLTELQATAAAGNTCLIIGFLPPRFMLSDHWRDNLKAVPQDRLTDDPETRLRALAARLDLPFAPTADALKAARARLGQSAPLYIPGDYTHLDATGHAVIATSLAETVRPVLDDPDACTYRMTP